MEPCDPAVVADVGAAFARYEQALVANDLATLDDLFWHDERTVRIGLDDRQDGFSAVRAFRRSQARQTPPRTLCDTSILTFGDDVAIVTTGFVPTDGSPEGRQSQTWIRFADGWRVVAAHVSLAASWSGEPGREVLDARHHVDPLVAADRRDKSASKADRP